MDWKIQGKRQGLGVKQYVTFIPLNKLVDGAHKPWYTLIMFKRKGSGAQQLVSAKLPLFEDKALLLSLQGDLDQSTLLALKTLLEEIESSGKLHIILDLEKLESLRSSHLGLMWAAAMKLREAGGDYYFCGLNSVVQSAFEAAGFHNVVRFYKDREEAMNFVKSQIS